jgi:hypothetical protein
MKEGREREWVQKRGGGVDYKRGFDYERGEEYERGC